MPACCFQALRQLQPAVRLRWGKTTTETETWIDGTAEIVIDVIDTIVNGIDGTVATGGTATTIVTNLFPIPRSQRLSQM